MGISYGSVLNVTISSTSTGIGGFNVPAQSVVPATGGVRQFVATKSTPTGVASGTVDVEYQSGSSIVGGASTVNVGFTNNQTSDTIDITIPTNYTENQRTLSIVITGFNQITNATGQSTPITIGYITQSGGAFL